jgi:hypothetical protein
LPQEIVVKNFTKQELDVLFLAVELWENEKPDFDAIAAKVFSESLKAPDAEEAKEMFNVLVRKAMVDHQAETKVKKERGCILRSKILSMRDEVELDEFLKSSMKPNQANQN